MQAGRNHGLQTCCYRGRIGLRINSTCNNKCAQDEISILHLQWPNAICSSSQRSTAGILPQGNLSAALWPKATIWFQFRRYIAGPGCGPPMPGFFSSRCIKRKVRH